MAMRLHTEDGWSALILEPEDCIAAMSGYMQFLWVQCWEKETDEDRCAWLAERTGEAVPSIAKSFFSQGNNDKALGEVFTEGVLMLQGVASTRLPVEQRLLCYADSIAHFNAILIERKYKAERNPFVSIMAEA
jgi:hypothetical protein